MEATLPRGVGMSTLLWMAREPSPNLKCAVIGPAGSVLHFKNAACRAKARKKLDGLKAEQAGEKLKASAIQAALKPFVVSVPIYRGYASRYAKEYRQHQTRERDKENKNVQKSAKTKNKSAAA